MLELVTDRRVDLAASDARHGLGLFETLRVEQGRVLRLERHLGRLARGTDLLGLPGPPPADKVRAWLDRNAGCDRIATGAVRLFAVDGRLAADARPMDLNSIAPVEVAVARCITRYSGSLLNRFKTFAYLENLLLAREAEALGAFDAIALNEVGQLTDGGRTNVFLVRRGELLTPPAAGGALPGILREVILEAGLGREAELRPEDLRAAEAVILCNALRELVPVSRLQGVGDLDPSPAMLERMREAAASRR